MSNFCTFAQTACSRYNYPQTSPRDHSQEAVCLQPPSSGRQFLWTHGGLLCVSRSQCQQHTFNLQILMQPKELIFNILWSKSRMHRECNMLELWENSWQKWEFCCPTFCPYRDVVLVRVKSLNPEPGEGMEGLIPAVPASWVAVSLSHWQTSASASLHNREHNLGGLRW